jgi:hypothetical protein
MLVSGAAILICVAALARTANATLLAIDFIITSNLIDFSIYGLNAFAIAVTIK